MKIRILFFLLAGLSIFQQAHGQLNPQGVAPGLVYPVDENIAVQKFNLQVDVKNLIHEDETGVPTGVPYRIGYAVPIYTDLFELGQWIKMDDGRSFFRAILSSPGAKGVNVAFEDFYIPANSQLFFYDPAKSTVYGGYTDTDNHESRMFPGPLVEGEKVIIEYFEPDPSLVTEKPVFFVKDIMHFYRPINESLKNQSIGDSEDCHVNINCIEGEIWQDEKRGIARILLRAGGSSGWCSGTLVNNTSQDGTPYFLTAQHCGDGASAADHNLWQFRFNFERPGCEETGVPATQTVTGSKLVAIAEMDGGSDMRLLKLNFTPPQTWQPYYNGWDRSPIPALNGVGIHHPAGDVKKISTYTATATNVQSPVISGSTMATNSAWNIFFVATATSHGVTEGGSSGSPMFNENGLVVGSLTGGSSSCNSPNGSNIYGKLNYHWESNGDEGDRQLKPWLDPLNTGQLTLAGLDPYPVPVVTNVAAKLNNDYSVTLTWDKPAFPIFGNWYTYAGSYSSVRHETPERATRFDFKQLLDLDTFYVKKVSHLFWQHPSFPWGTNTRFIFKIYDEDGETLLYRSDEIVASNFQVTNRSVILELEEDIMVTKPFYVSIAPLATGQPSSLSLEMADTTNSVYGSPGNWQTLKVDDKYYELLINVFGSGVPTPSEEAEKNLQASENHCLGVSTSDIFQVLSELNTPLETSDKSIANIQYYRVYRNGEAAGTTQSAEEFSYTDSEGLVQEQTYFYQVASVFNLNPTNPNSPFIESELSDSIEIKVSFVGLTETELKGYSLFPNPFTNQLTVKLAENASYNKAHISITDTRGVVVLSQSMDNNSFATFDLSIVNAGLYFVIFDFDGIIHTEKVIKY